MCAINNLPCTLPPSPAHFPDMNALGFIGPKNILDLLAGAGLPVVSHPDPILAARQIAAHQPELTILIDAADLPATLATWATVNSAGLNLAILDAPNGVLAATPGAIHVPHTAPIPLATLYDYAGLETPSHAHNITIPAPTNETSSNETVYVPPASTPLPSPRRKAIASIGDTFAAASTAHRRPKARLIFTFSGKGGVLKTTMAMTLAQRAATAGKRVLLIDGNRGQGDIRSCLRLSNHHIPTIYDHAVGYPLGKCILPPEKINALRPKGLDPVAFYYLAAPEPGMTSSHVVSSDAYRNAITAGREGVGIDLVVVDTQVLNDTDESGLVDQVFLPMLHDDAWAVALTDASSQSVENIAHRLDDFGLDPARTFIVGTLITQREQALADPLRSFVRPWGAFAGTIGYNEDAKDAQRQGNLLDRSPVFRQATGTILTTVLGDHFDDTAPTPPRTGLRRLFTRHTR